MKKLHFLLIITLTFLAAQSFVAVASPETAKNDIAPEATADSSLIAPAQKRPKLIDFGSKQCVACNAMELVLEECMKNHADKFKTEFVDVWVKENQEFAKSHNIESIPTQVFFSAAGEELFRHTGFISEEDILAKWFELGYRFDEAKGSSTAPDSDRAD
jgi:thioredoxin 1